MRTSAGGRRRAAGGAAAAAAAQLLPLEIEVAALGPSRLHALRGRLEPVPVLEWQQRSRRRLRPRSQRRSRPRRCLRLTERPPPLPTCPS